MNVTGELGDLLVFLAIVVVPLAVGAIVIPVGRALAERIRGPQARPDDQQALLRAMTALDSRLATMQQALETTAIDVERIGEYQRSSLRVQGVLPTPSQTPHPRTITPH